MCQQRVARGGEDLRAEIRVGDGAGQLEELARGEEAQERRPRPPGSARGEDPSLTVAPLDEFLEDAGGFHVLPSGLMNGGNKVQPKTGCDSEEGSLAETSMRPASAVLKMQATC